MSPGAECSETRQCPGDLVCTLEGFCCEAGTSCGGGDIDAAPDAPIDAADPAFTSFSSEYSCDGQTDVLVHFTKEPVNFVDACPNPTSMVADDEAIQGPGKFDDGVQLNSTAMSTKRVTYFPGSTAITDDYTIEAWISMANLPAGPDHAVVSSRFKATNSTIDDAAWVLAITGDGRVRFQAFKAGIPCNAPFDPVVSPPGLINSSSMDHIRVAVDAMTPSAARAVVFVNGFEVASTALTGERCASTNALIAIGDVEQTVMSPTSSPGYEPFQGIVDEVRLSTVARLTDADEGL